MWTAGGEGWRRRRCRSWLDFRRQQPPPPRCKQLPHVPAMGWPLLHSSLAAADAQQAASAAQMCLRQDDRSSFLCLNVSAARWSFLLLSLGEMKTASCWEKDKQEER